MWQRVGGTGLDLTYRARGTDERDTAVVGVDGRVAAGESDLFCWGQ